MSDAPSPLLPGATVGILGDGQLGRMLALAARAMGYRIAVFGPGGTDAPAAQVADTVFTAAYDDIAAVQRFAQAVSVVTFEFENIAVEAAEAAAQFVPVRPSGAVLHTTQNRLREKTFLRDHGFPVTPFAALTDVSELPAAVAAIGLPAVLKTAGFGYDGKGQRIVSTPQELAAAYTELTAGEAVPLILEAFVTYAFEMSVVAARGTGGTFVAYPPVRNDHSHHILDVTTAPAPGLSPVLAAEAEHITRGVLEALDVIGVLCVEFFVTMDGRLIINELAPRPHNSGHWTIEGAEISQFEQQLRAVCGLPLGATVLRTGGAAMANLLGDVWETASPNWPAALAFPGLHLHLYGKSEARPGRKMGHLTVVADSPEKAAALVRTARAALTEKTELRA